MYNDFNKKNNKEGPKFKVGDNVRISKYQNIFAKSCISNWSEEKFVIKKVKNSVLKSENVRKTKLKSFFFFLLKC